MRSLSFTLLLLILAVAAGGMVAVRVAEGNLHRIFGSPPVKPGDRLYGFDPNAAQSIVLSGGGVNVVCEKRMGRWMLKEPWQDRADPLFARAIIAFTVGTRVVDAIPRDELDDAQSGFGEERVNVLIQDAAGEPLARYRMGRVTAVMHLDPETGEEHPTVFLRPRESGRNDYIYACTGDIRGAFKDGFRHLRDHRPYFTNPLFLQSVRIRNTEGELLLSRTSDKAPWRITKPLDLRTDPSAVKQLLTGIYGLKARNVLNRADVTLPTGEGDVRTISIRHFGEPQDRTLTIYPASPEAEMQYAVIDDRPDAVFELLRRPLAADAGGEDLIPLAALPDTVNQLRNKTLTNIDITSVQGIMISPSTGEEIAIIRETPRDEFLLASSGTTQPVNLFALHSMIKALTETQVTAFATDAAGDDLSPFGLDRPALSLKFLAFSGDRFELLFGRSKEGVWHAMRSGTTTVVKLDDSFIGEIAVRPWQWRHTSLWSISPVDVVGIERRLESAPPLTLEYQFTTESWRAIEGGHDRSAELATERANRLLPALLNLHAGKWLDVNDPEATAALQRPVLSYALLIKRVDEEGNFAGLGRRELVIAPASDAPSNRLFFGRIDGEPHPFRLDHGTVYQLAVDLFGDD